MPAEKYFEKFPIITYSNNQVVDITRRVTLLDKVSSNPYVFYPYEITAEERPDQLSDRYYEDPYMSWLLYLTNKVTDPYYEWYMHEREFYDFIDKKYGSEEKAKSKIKYYRNDWSNSSIISQSAFNALSGGERKYWEPYVRGDIDDFKVFGKPTSFAPKLKPAKTYKRKEQDWIITTNKVVSYEVANSSNFIVDEICTVAFDKYRVGRGQVVSASNNFVTLQHVSGDYVSEKFTTELNYKLKDEEGNFILSDPSNPTQQFILYEYKKQITEESYILGSESRANTNIISSVVVANNLPDEEVIYWKPVSYYDYEYEKNEYYKTIRVMESNLKYNAVENLKDLLEE